MTSGGNNFNDFPEYQLAKFCSLNSTKANREHAIFCSKQHFSLVTAVNINSSNTDNSTGLAVLSG